MKMSTTQKTAEIAAVQKNDVPSDAGGNLAPLDKNCNPAILGSPPKPINHAGWFN